MRIKLRLCLILAAGLVLAEACATSVPDTAQTDVRTLQAQVDDLSRVLTQLHDAQPADQRQIMGEYWSMLQKQLRYARDLPGVVSRGCTDWMLSYPPISGGAITKAIKPCPTMHDIGPASSWDLPVGMSPLLFELTMRRHLDILVAQVAAISTETDPSARADRYRQLYETRYQDIQTVLGRGWMWTPRDASALPDSHSMGAELLGRYCSQCHAAPPPQLRTQAEWQTITRRMHDIIQTQSRTEIMGVQMPSTDEFDLIASYLEAHADGAQ